ncbi:hypothetical protein B0H14DRAFT_2857315, partial [Mycena olivaceomarginata]
MSFTIAYVPLPELHPVHPRLAAVDLSRSSKRRRSRQVATSFWGYEELFGEGVERGRTGWGQACNLPYRDGDGGHLRQTRTTTLNLIYDCSTGYHHTILQPYFLPAMRSDLAAVRARIVEIERLIAELRAEQSVAQERLDSYKYPAVNLPNEIISEIFIHFLPIAPFCPPLRGILSPTALTHICSTWRAIAMAIPALWTAINLTICDAWLSRSGSCPLSIVVPDCRWPLAQLPGMVTAIVPHRERLEHLIIYGPSERTFPLVDGPLPRLRHLHLTLFNSPLNKFTLQSAPKLRTAVLNQTAVLRVTLPWGQLTSLALSAIDPQKEWASILQHATRLVHCDPDIILPSLEVLLLSNPDDVGAITGLLATFVVPALLRLEIPESFLGSDIGPDPLDSLTSFISTSDCKIQEILITKRPSRLCFPESEDKYRAAFPSVPKFSFEYNESDDEDDERDDDDDESDDGGDERATTMATPT